MKKIILAAVTIITMMLCIAQPLFVHAEDNYFTHEYIERTDLETTVNDIDNLEFIKGLSSVVSDANIDLSNDYFIYFVYAYDNPTTLAPKRKRVIESFISFDSANISFSSNNLTVSNLVNQYSHFYLFDSNNGNLVNHYNFPTNNFEIDFDSKLFDIRNSSNSQPNFINFDKEILGFPIIYTNIPELLNTNALTVFVDFSPDLIGNVDRQITATDGTKSMRKDLAMQVINQSNFPIQYDMRIYKVNQNSSRDWSLNPETFATQFDSDSVSYDDDPVFIYYKNEWVYTTNYDSETTFWDLEPVKENKGASWHYLAANSQDIVTFNFTQINLDENVDYYVEVRAVRNDYGCSSEKIVYLASDNPAESEYKQIQGDDIVTVYHEQFKMINYSDVVYNPNEESNGVLPYNGKNGIVSRNTYQYGRNARDNGNGNIDYTARNLYTDQNSWYNQQYNRVVSNHTSNASSGSVPSNITNLFDSFMKFVSYVFLRFPANMQTIYVYGFVSVVVLGIVLKVIK